MINTFPDPKKLGATSATGATALCGAAYSVAPCVSQGATSATKHGWHGSFVAPSKTVGATRKPVWLLVAALVAPVAPPKTGQEVENRERP